MTAAEFAAWMAGALALLSIAFMVARLVKAGHHAVRRLERIEHLACELAPNGGSSIKDSVQRIEEKVEVSAETLADHETRLARAEGQVEAIALVTAVSFEEYEHREAAR